MIHSRWNDKPAEHLSDPAMQPTGSFKVAEEAWVLLSPSLRGAPVLIIEDGAASRTALQSEIRRLGFEPSAFAALHEAEKWLRNNPARCVVLDAELPALDLGKAIACLRSVSQQPDLPVVVLNSYIAIQSQTDDPNPPFVRVIKPFKLSSLSRGLRQLLDSVSKPDISAASPVPTLGSAKIRPSERFPMRILLADDNEINQRVGLLMLQQMGYTADLAANGQEVLDALDQKSYDILLLDMQMPVMDGMEATRRIREHEKIKPGGPALIIIALTARAVNGDREKILAIGLDDYLSKPVHPEVFQDTVLRWAQRIKQRVDTKVILDRRSTEASCTRAAVKQKTVSVRSRCVSAPAAIRKPIGDLPVDLDQFRNWAGRDEDSVKDLAHLYLDRTERLLQQLKAALEKGDVADARRIAHSGAGSSRACGIRALAKPFVEIERLSNAGRLGDIHPHFETANRELEKVRTVLLAQQQNVRYAAETN